MGLIGVAGGSGSGKTTLAIGLIKKYPDRFALLHIDDYFKNREDLPITNGHRNRDCPESILFDTLHADLIRLLGGQIITILTKSELYNPDYKPNERKKIERDIEPRPDVILEGHLCFCDSRIRKLMQHAVYLDMPIRTSIERQSTNRLNLGEDYFNTVLEPGHHAYIEPSKRNADFIVEVTGKSPQQVLALTEEYLQLQ